MNRTDKPSCLSYIKAAELLVDVTSHELRQPVSAILNCSQLVRTNLENLAEKLRTVGTGPFMPTPGLIAILEEDLEVRALLR